MLLEGRVGPQVLTDGTEQEIRLGRTGAQVVTELHGRYQEQSRRGNIFVARAVVTAPVIFTTAAGTGGPLLWNGSTTVQANILAVNIGVVTTQTSVIGAIGVTGATGQTSAPTSTTAIDSLTNGYLGGPNPACSVYRVGTPTNAGTWFFPLYGTDTGTTALSHLPMWYDLGGMFTVPPGAWFSVAASATLTTGVYQLGLIWEEVPA